MQVPCVQFLPPAFAAAARPVTGASDAATSLSLAPTDATAAARCAFAGLAAAASAMQQCDAQRLRLRGVPLVVPKQPCQQLPPLQVPRL